jgi:hypothetical protein
MEFQGCVYDCKSNIGIGIEEMLSLKYGRWASEALSDLLQSTVVFLESLNDASKASSLKMFYESSALSFCTEPQRSSDLP